MLRVTADTEKAVFTIEDTGIVIPPEEAEHIFEEFVQLDEYYDGTGIGLTIARSLVRRHLQIRLYRQVHHRVGHHLRIA